MKTYLNICRVVLLPLFITLLASEGEAIRCYQCSTSTELVLGEDSCGAYKAFNKSRHVAVECNSDESHTLGSFCMKIVHQGRKGFIWDGRWRQVIRRCASVAERGVTGVCNWGVLENGVYWEECYCSQDGCNSASSTQVYIPLVVSTIFALKLSLI